MYIYINNVITVLKKNNVRDGYIKILSFLKIIIFKLSKFDLQKSSKKLYLKSNKIKKNNLDPIKTVEGESPFRSGYFHW